MQVTAIVGSYRKGGIVDSAVDEILAAAKEAGADVTKIYLIDKHVEFCRNCRACMQPEGPKRGDCSLADEMGAILDQIERSDAFVLASPMNFGTVTAVMKRFIERLACYGYWPWETTSPKVRHKRKDETGRGRRFFRRARLHRPAVDADRGPVEEMRGPAGGQEDRRAFHRPGRQATRARRSPTRRGGVPAVWAGSWPTRRSEAAADRRSCSTNGRRMRPLRSIGTSNVIAPPFSTTCRV